MILYKICLYNFLISILGFGSGQVFLTYVYDYYVLNNVITERAYNLYVGITEVLPGATSVKILTLIAYDNLSIIGLIIAMLFFVIPTIIIIYGCARLHKNKRFETFFKNLGMYFTPVLSALMIVLLMRLINSNVSDNIHLIYLFITVALGLFYESRKFKFNFFYILLTNTVVYFIIF